MRVLCVQPTIEWQDKSANYRRVEGLLRGQARPGDLVVLPEMFATGFSMDVAAIAETVGGPTEAFLAGLARAHRCTVIGGVVTLGPDGRGRNEALALGPDGQLLARYAKLHPFRFAGETDHYGPGSDVAVFDWAGLAVAPTVCYDLRFPELYRRSVRRGATLLVVIANWPRPRADHWRTLLRARAIENQAFVVGVNRAGADPKNDYAGGSLIVGPKGEVLAEAGEGECLLPADLNAEDLARWRAEFPALADIRPDLLGP